MLSKFIKIVFIRDPPSLYHENKRIKTNRIKDRKNNVSISKTLLFNINNQFFDFLNTRLPPSRCQVTVIPKSGKTLDRD